MIRVRTVAVTLPLAALLLACSCPSKPAPRPDATGKDGKADSRTQNERSQWVDRATKEGVIAEVKYNQRQLWTGPKWAALDFKDKEKAANMVAAYVFQVPPDGELLNEEVLTIHDGKTGKSIGTFSRSGLRLD